MMSRRVRFPKVDHTLQSCPNKYPLLVNIVVMVFVTREIIAVNGAKSNYVTAISFSVLRTFEIIE